MFREVRKRSLFRVRGGNRGVCSLLIIGDGDALHIFQGRREYNNWLGASIAPQSEPHLLAGSGVGLRFLKVEVVFLFPALAVVQQ